MNSDDNDDMYDYDEDYNYDDNNDAVNNQLTDGYEILKEDSFWKKREEQIEEMLEYLSLPKEEAEIVLINYQWNTELIYSLWYQNVEKNKIKFGIEQSKESKKKIDKKFVLGKECPICFGEIKKGNFLSLKCGHNICKECFTDYIKEKIDSDPLTVISTKCPMNLCNLICTSSIFLKALEGCNNYLAKYKKYLLKNFTEANADIKWCPNPSCGLCVRVPGHGAIDIKCQCGKVFCFKCLKDSHRPCDCEMIQRWEKKNTNNEENVKWILINTKQCPHCHKYIEKNQGCNHMVCQKNAGGCGYEFCWICLGEWKKHGNSYYKCTFEKEKDQNLEKTKQSTKYELERYIKFFELYMNHFNAQKIAITQIKKIDEYKNLFMALKNKSLTEVGFLSDAINTVIDLRRMLKNSYVLGYYLKNDKKTKNFEFYQEKLDKNTDMLHEKLEKSEIPNLLQIDNYEEFEKDFNSFRNSIINLIATLQNYQKNITNWFENDVFNLINEELLMKDKL